MPELRAVAYVLVSLASALFVAIVLVTVARGAVATALYDAPPWPYSITAPPLGD